MKKLFRAALIVILVLGAGPAFAAAGDSGTPLATIQDFAWLAGHWQGDSGETHLEEFCSKPVHGLMMCMVRFTDSKTTTGMEFVTLSAEANGIEEHIRFFSPGLGEHEGAKAVVLRLTKFSPSESVLENIDNAPTGARSVTLTRIGPDDAGVHIIVISEDGQVRFIDARWKRVK